MWSCLKNIFCPEALPGVEFERWNETSIAFMFIRLLSKKNLPYSDSILTLEEFNTDYDTLEKYINWNKYKNIKIASHSYNFTAKNMSYFISLIKYEPDDRDALISKWKSIMYKF